MIKIVRLTCFFNCRTLPFLTVPQFSMKEAKTSKKLKEMDMKQNK